MNTRKITLLGPQGTNIFILLIFLFFIFISWFTLYTLTDFQGLEFDVDNILTRQVVFSIASIIVFFLLTYLSIDNLQNYANILFFIVVGLLGSLFFTQPRLGVRRWFDLGPIDIQPSEFAKVIIVVFVANYLSRNLNKGILIALIFGTVLLINFQPDLGTALIISFVFLSMLLLSNIKLRYMSLLFLIGISLFFIFLEIGSRVDNINIVTQYQISRLNEFFSADLDFSQSQSRLLISSGGLFGQYFAAENIEKIFVPVETTDFIFAAYAYNFGFFGILFLLALWGLLFSRLRRILTVSDSDFDKFVIAGFIALLSFQIIINISTVVGLIPVTGLPFPLLSLGGSSMVSIAVIFGITNRIFIENNITI
tara:strand:+ start:457 stop:1557 length:1101 start_codon:yes stop_codon:yes gene_type:complete